MRRRHFHFTFLPIKHAASRFRAVYRRHFRFVKIVYLPRFTSARVCFMPHVISCFCFDVACRHFFFFVIVFHATPTIIILLFAKMACCALFSLPRFLPYCYAVTPPCVHFHACRRYRLRFHRLPRRLPLTLQRCVPISRSRRCRCLSSATMPPRGYRHATLR